MNGYKQELRPYALQIHMQLEAIDKIVQISQKDSVASGEILTKEVLNQLKDIGNGASLLEKKLETGEFEIAIVGLEKAGKSTFANALMGNDILPTRNSRCTYTTTTIRADKNDEAVVNFFDADMFNLDFQKKLKQMGIPGWDTKSFSGITLREYQSLYQALSPEKQRLYHDQNLDLEEILSDNNKKIIQSHLGREPLSFFGGEELRSENFKRYISAPGYAHAVREVVLNSSRLKDMPEAVIYDVPGLDSPTQIHKDQTIEKMKSADAIILIAGADRPSFTGPLVEILEKTSYETDADGLKLGDKLFIFANRADQAANLEENMNTIRGELENRVGMDGHMISSRLFHGSARAHLDGKNNIDDGIQKIHKQLKEYYDNERFSVLKKRFFNLCKRLQEILRDLKTEEPEDPGEETHIATESLDHARGKIRESLENYRRELIETYSGPGPLTEEIVRNVVEKFDPAQMGVNETDLEAAVKKKYTSSRVEMTTAIDEFLREEKYAKIYRGFHKSILDFAVDEYKKIDEKIIGLLSGGLGVTEGSESDFRELMDNIHDYVDQRKADRFRIGYYDSLISRFAMDIFELLLRFPFGDDARWKKWETEKSTFFSLAMFDPHMDPGKTPDRQSFHYLLLFHNRDPKLVSPKTQETIEQIKKYIIDFVGSQVLSVDTLEMIRKLVMSDPEGALNTLKRKLESGGQKQSAGFFGGAIFDNAAEKESKVDSALSDLTQGVVEKEIFLDVGTYRSYFQRRPPKTGKDIQDEINEDIRILHQVVKETVVYAICLEKPFLDMELRTIDNLLLSLGDDFRKFMDKNIRLIAPERYHNLEISQKRRLNRNQIRHEIRKIEESLSKALPELEIY